MRWKSQSPGSEPCRNRVAINCSTWCQAQAWFAHTDPEALFDQYKTYSKDHGGSKGMYLLHSLERQEFVIPEAGSQGLFGRWSILETQFESVIVSVFVGIVKKKCTYESILWLWSTVESNILYFLSVIVRVIWYPHTQPLFPVQLVMGHPPSAHGSPSAAFHSIVSLRHRHHPTAGRARADLRKYLGGHCLGRHHCYTSGCSDRCLT